jgi:hypothetical protein
MQISPNGTLAAESPLTMEWVTATMPQLSHSAARQPPIALIVKGRSKVDFTGTSADNGRFNEER